MSYYYHVVLGKKHMDLVKAANEEQAIKLIEKIYGPACKYHTTNQYKAIQA